MNGEGSDGERGPHAQKGCAARQQQWLQWLSTRPPDAGEANAQLIAQSLSVARGDQPQLNPANLDTVMQVC